nr:serine/threonine-protein kinase [uncultured Blautia sp.]
MMDKLPVSVWPEWKIIEKIGEGSFGKVYKAQRTEQGKIFYSAVKVITIPSNAGELSSVRSETPNEQSVREYFHGLVEECIQEVSTMEYFRGNSHVVSVEDYKVVEYLDDIGWDIYIRMEYLTSFLDYCAGRELTEEDVIQLGIDLCKALEYCQKQNIIHRDIKPENIFVSRFGEFKLGDFGIARELERTMSGLSKKGTFSYMAPEMYKGEPYDAKVDIYSLGIVLYKLRNHNRLPFISLEKQLITYRDKENALNRRMSGENPPRPAEAGEGLADIILKACAYDRQDRFETAEEFREALEALKYQKPASVKKQPEEPEEPDATDNEDYIEIIEEEPEKTVVAGRTSRPHKKKRGIDPLVIAVVVMSIAVCVVVGVFIWLVKENSELQRLKQSVTETVQSAENKQLQETLEKIRTQATTITDNLNDYNWIGSEEDGKISYLDDEGVVKKVLVYPSLSQDGYYEEYYYWEGELFFAYIWADHNTLSYLKEGEQKVDLYYYDDGKLIRWIDENNVCHDNETDNEEYVDRGKKYWDQAEEYKSQLNASVSSTDTDE